MKKLITLLLAAFITISINAQWQPKPGNPYKWYTVVKDTTIKGFALDSFDICLYQWSGKYLKFSVDSIGQLKSPVHLTTIWFKEYAFGMRNSNAVSENDYLNNYAAEFEGIPFTCEGDSTPSISNQINIFLSKKYNVELNNIKE